jgi:hypothetical protein
MPYCLFSDALNSSERAASHGVVVLMDNELGSSGPRLWPNAGYHPGIWNDSDKTRNTL